MGRVCKFQKWIGNASQVKEQCRKSSYIPVEDLEVVSRFPLKPSYAATANIDNISRTCVANLLSVVYVRHAHTCMRLIALGLQTHSAYTAIINCLACLAPPDMVFSCKLYYPLVAITKTGQG